MDDKEIVELFLQRSETAIDAVSQRYGAMCRGIATSDTLQLLRVVPFVRIWEVVAIVFGAAGVLIGVGGSTMAIRRFLKV